MALLQLQEKFAVFFLAVISLSCAACVDDPGNTPCTSVICQEVGEEIIGNIDNTVDPCTDFFQHACGGWIVKQSETTTNQFQRLERKVEQDVKDLLEKDEGEVGGAIQKVKDFYKSCMDLVTINSTGVQPVIAMLTANGDWPLTVPSADWNPQHLTWQQIHENVMKLTEYPALFDFSVRVEQNKSNTDVIMLGAISTLGDELRTTTMWERETIKYSNSVKPTVKKTVKDTAYEKFVLSVALEFIKSRGLNVTATDVKADIRAMLAFRKELQNVYKTGSANNFAGGSQYQITTINEVQHIWNAAINNNTEYKVDWLETLKTRFEGTGIVIDENKKLSLIPGAYLQKLATLLSKTSVRTIVNYIHWYAIEQLLPYGDEVMRGLLLSYQTKMRGVTKTPARWRTCSMEHKMVHAVSFMYVKAHFSAESRKSVIELIDQLREASKEAISNSTWMDENARTFAKAKVDAMKVKLGYPDWYDVPGKIDEYYNELTIGPTYLENVIAANRFHRKKKLQELHNPVIDEDRWELTALDANAGYLDSSNSLIIPAAMIRMPMYHYEQPASLNFGGLGAIIGHEIFHGFDNSGRVQNEDGQYWSNSTFNAYAEKLECIVNQYSQYEIINDSYTGNPLYVNGMKTLDETVADSLGFPIGFKAFQQYKRLHLNETHNIPALKDYSDEKLFFYGLANAYCDVVHPIILKYAYPLLHYPPKKIRINGAVSNIKEFANTFGCAAGSKMNPTNRCVLWD